MNIDALLLAAEFNKEGGESYTGQTNVFNSWRRGDVNLIVTTDPQFARKHRAANKVCKALNLMAKADRVLVFQAVLYGN